VTLSLSAAGFLVVVRRRVGFFFVIASDSSVDFNDNPILSLALWLVSVAGLSAFIR
jgi:hypothetical protein